MNTEQTPPAANASERETSVVSESERPREQWLHGEMLVESNTARELEARARKAERELAEARERLKKSRDMEAICHCGERISDHGMYCGHTPIENPEPCPYVEKLSRLPADWTQDSSLETWFPLSAEKLKAQAEEIERLRAALKGLLDSSPETIGDWDQSLDKWNTAISRANAALAAQNP